MPEPIATWNPARGVWVTAQASLICGHSVAYSATWPRSGLMLSGQLFQPPGTAARTFASGDSSSPGTVLFPTPDASAGTRGGSQHPAKRVAGGHTVNLGDVIEKYLCVPDLFPTPRTGSNRNSRRALEEGSGLGLEQAVELVLGLVPRELTGGNTRPRSSSGNGSSDAPPPTPLNLGLAAE